ncbi:hypothetical protein Corgl_1596 [Coriobacterium glomerans PW2]|uniref:Uncharacterized protein n=1 Tax=Coriobacterium glomerans (strain ATCC 49209 / DSM 20642 / JCM 10262 / PW2) TaxID=700015 RepID=F2N919_CORGP|nr:DUF5674 family protein [Coriobacterium glomerans]AEB07695.1 hypothetical protein Corgl_1596 [Coriobacterium glomerans PW2]
MNKVTSISVEDLRSVAERTYSDFVKAVVDTRRGIVVLDADLHADEEQFLLEDGSAQDDLWGINLYPDKFRSESFVEFKSLINIRPWQQNRSQSVQDPQTRNEILSIISEVVHE